MLIVLGYERQGWRMKIQFKMNGGEGFAERGPDGAWHLVYPGGETWLYGSSVREVKAEIRFRGGVVK